MVQRFKACCCLISGSRVPPEEPPREMYYLGIALLGVCNFFKEVSNENTSELEWGSGLENKL